MAASGEDYLIQYVILRGDLKFPTGALVSQGCHAASAALHIFRDYPDTSSFLANLDRMHVCVLKATDDSALMGIADQLTQKNLDFKLWIEQPENIPTCIALRPYFKASVQSLFSALKLFR